MNSSMIKEGELQASPETLESIQRTAGHGLAGGNQILGFDQGGRRSAMVGGTSVSVWGSGTVKVWTSPDLKQDGFFIRADQQTTVVELVRCLEP